MSFYLNLLMTHFMKYLCIYFQSYLFIDTLKKLFNYLTLLCLSMDEEVTGEGINR